MNFHNHGQTQNSTHGFHFTKPIFFTAFGSTSQSPSIHEVSCRNFLLCLYLNFSFRTPSMNDAIFKDDLK